MQMHVLMSELLITAGNISIQDTQSMQLPKSREVQNILNDFQLLSAVANWEIASSEADKALITDAEAGQSNWYHHLLLRAQSASL